MGVVYLARDTLLDRKVAVKLLRQDVLGNQDRWLDLWLGPVEN